MKRPLISVEKNVYTLFSQHYFLIKDSAAFDICKRDVKRLLTKFNWQLLYKRKRALQPQA